MALVAVFAYGAIDLGFWNWGSVKQILVLASLAGLASVGQTLLILMGGFDLSISGFIVSSALVVSVLKEKWGVSFAVAILIAVVGAGMLGALAGQICHRYQIQPLIVTLAMGTIALGLIQVQTGGLVLGHRARLADQRWPRRGRRRSGSSTSRRWSSIWAVVAVLMGLFLHRTIAGGRVLRRERTRAPRSTP